MRPHRTLRLLVAVLLCAACTTLAPAATTHVVQKGETLSSIAARYGLSAAELARANRLRDADLVKRGQKLLIPSKPATFVEHTVSRGESLASIAKRYKVSVADIRAYNALPDPDHITRGQKLRIPVKGDKAPATPAAAPATPAPAPSTAAAPPAGDRRRVLPASIQGAIDAAAVGSGRWKNIVVHHSGTKEGSGKGMDRYHREERHMENGLAYHFVIGNGHGMRDGEIYISRRWTDQLDGGHLAIPALNANSIGICLVGDFSRSKPTARQLDTLEALCRALMRKTRVTRENVTTHRLIHPKHTQCPGRYFPTVSFAKRLEQP
ncbi:MAG: LysM peptidoglycan-binding domain-containing protein [Opitutaceae bacterium]|nr:LysM peptidoglycan-binding domain-containing protein [Opitutaceae bacterium]